MVLSAAEPETMYHHVLIHDSLELADEEVEILLTIMKAVPVQVDVITKF